MFRRIRILLVAFIALTFAFSPEYMVYAETPTDDYLGDNPGFTDYSVYKEDEFGEGFRYYYASDERDATCSRMNGMANVSWKVNKTFDYAYAGTKEATIEAGRTYYGLPYTQKNRDYSDATSSTVQSRMTDAANGGTVKGVDCASAVSYAIRTGKGMTGSDTYLKVNGSTYLASAFLFDGTRAGGDTVTNSAGKDITFRDALHHVGWYGTYSNYSSALTTGDILDRLCPKDGGKSAYYPSGSGNFYSNVYAKVRPGDVMVKVIGTSGHTAMATGVKIVYKNGEIDPEQSIIYITDQNTPNLRKVGSGTTKWGSSWRRNYSGENATFKKLRENGYLPVSAFDGNLTYTISYDDTEGSGAPADQTKKIYNSIKLSTEVPYRTGYTFAGWEPLYGLVGELYQPGDYYNEDIDNQLGAVWKVNTCTVYYDANGGTGAPSSQKKVYERDLIIDRTIPTRDGYTFVGWSRYSNSSSAEYFAGGSFTDDTVTANSTGGSVYLYAVWRKNNIDPSDDEHTEHVWNGGVTTQEATCVKAGVRLYTCTICGETKTEVIPATGQHNYGSWITVKEPTYDATGLRECSCTMCGGTKQEVIEKLIRPDDDPSDPEEPTKPDEPTEPEAGTTEVVDGNTVTVTSDPEDEVKTVEFTEAKNIKQVTVPATVTLNDEIYKVTSIDEKAFTAPGIRTIIIGKNVRKIKKYAFKYSKATKLIIKSKLLSKARVKGSLVGSKIKTVQVKVSTKKSTNRKYVKKYKNYFTKKNAGRKVIVK